MAKRLLSTQRIVNLAADPATGTAGEMYFNTTSSRLRYHDGTSWIDFASLPQGGTTGQILAKIDGTNYNTEWIDNYTSQLKHLVKAGEALTKGQAVYISSADGTNMIASKASNNTEMTSSRTLGIVAQNLAQNAQGFVITEGLIDGLDTSTATAGDPVWLGVNGNLLYGSANKPYAPANLVYIGVVTRAQQNNGEIFVSIQNGFELDELHNVLISNPTNSQTLVYDAATSLWKNANASGGGSSVTVSDTAPSTPTQGNLWFNSTNGKTYIYFDSYWIEVGNTTSTAPVSTDVALSNSWWMGV